MTAVAVFICIFGFAFLYFRLIAPSRRKHADVELLRGKIISHRGLYGNGAPENSFEAYRFAAENGLPIELDIRLTADGEVVCFHDGELLNACGVEGKVSDKTLKELKELTLFGTKLKIPTLSEALSAVNGAVPLLIELKADGKTAKELCRAADKILSEYGGIYLIQSFYSPVLRWYKKHRSSVARGQLSAPFKGGKLYMKAAALLLFNFLGRPDFLSYEYCGTKRFTVRLLRSTGTAVFGWTFKTDEDIKVFGKYCDAYISEQKRL